MATAAKKNTPYEGPECPRCGKLLGDESRRTGNVICPSCGSTFEATAFNPPQRRMQIVEVVFSPILARIQLLDKVNSVAAKSMMCGPAPADSDGKKRPAPGH